MLEHLDFRPVAFQRRGALFGGVGIPGAGCRGEYTDGGYKDVLFPES
jgi:hypothetical protein